MVRLDTLFITSVVLMGFVYGSTRPNRRDWDLFKSMHNKTYNSPIVEVFRKSIFARNKDIVEKFNVEQSWKLGFRMGLNHLSDLTKSEISKLNGVRISKEDRAEVQNSPEAEKFLDAILNESVDVPDELDWRDAPGRVSRVKDQKHCGSSWAFAAIGTLEGQEVVRNKELIELSVQNLVDCDREYDQGCNWGFMSNALDFIKSQGGIDSEEAYPYEGTNGECRFQKDKVAFNDSGSAMLPTGDEHRLKEIVSKFGPVSVAIDATDNFQHYGGGIFNDGTCGATIYELDHALLVVGYGTDKEFGDYWIVKNSWGMSWGERGYINMARNRGNQCGIATRPVIPTF